MKKLLWQRRKKDFWLQFFRGSGPGGQHRNKRDTACRIVDKETGLRAECQEHKSKEQNKKSAFRKLVKKLIDHYESIQNPSSHTPKQVASFGQPRIRTYNECDDRVVDEQTGSKYSYKHTVGRGNINQIIEERRIKLLTSE